MEIREVYNQYGQRVRLFIKALVRDEWATEDLTQETFLKIQLHLKKLNVKVRLHRARKKFKDILEAHCNFEKDERNVLICTTVFPDGKDSNGRS